ncbi:hypothetical protein D3C73_1020640 [compost metagenome]
MSIKSFSGTITLSAIAFSGPPGYSLFQAYSITSGKLSDAIIRLNCSLDCPSAGCVYLTLTPVSFSNCLPNGESAKLGKNEVKFVSICSHDVNVASVLIGYLPAAVAGEADGCDVVAVSGVFSEHAATKLDATIRLTAMLMDFFVVAFFIQIPLVNNVMVCTSV